MQELKKLECQRWASKGINIKYEIRDNRKGYKAGVLREGMKHGYVKQCDYVAIFDADFQPEPDFLCRTIPFLVHNPEIGLVQARWKFGKLHIFSSFLMPLAHGCLCMYMNVVGDLRSHHHSLVIEEEIIYFEANMVNNKKK